jgi:hypothetical protein
VFAILVSAYAVRLWRSHFRNDSDGELQRVVKDYRSSIPSLALAVCLFIPAALFAHESDQNSSSALVGVSKVLQWPFWIAVTVFFLCGLSIQMFGAPTLLIPPNMRSKVN